LQAVLKNHLGRIRILGFINHPKSTFLVCVKAIQYYLIKESLLLNFLVHEYIFREYFHQKNFPEETWPKIFVGQDPDSNVYKSRIRIRSKIIWIRNTDWKQ
jgi:hypothetical protein